MCRHSNSRVTGSEDPLQLGGCYSKTWLFWSESGEERQEHDSYFFLELSMVKQYFSFNLNGTEHSRLKK